MFPNCKFVVIVLLSVATVKVDLASIVQAPKAADENWWKNAVIYQVYTRSFKDSANNDGIGDIQGIIEKLNYLKDSGVTAIWLPPMQQSLVLPKVDFGYEVIDYQDIHAEYGTIAVFEELIQQAHTLGIKIILELVPNHSSDQHPWFVESQNGEPNDFTEYYVWRAGVPGTPPNNWVSHLNEPAWTYEPRRRAWYLHQFGKEQPDLNYHTAAVREAMKGVLTFWLGKGVDGFIMGDVPYLIEDEDLRPEEPSGNGQAGDYESLVHAYTANQDATYDIISEWRDVVDAYNTANAEDDPRILITKAETDLEKAWEYCGTEDRKGAHFTYNFLLASGLSQDLKAQTIYNTIEQWIMEAPQECGAANWVLGNHDLHRVASRFQPEVVDGLNILLAFLPGVMITYNGEEIGQENGEVSVSECKDPLACSDPNYNEISRDFERTPFHWDETTNAGFGTAAPWLPVSAKHTTNNLNSQSRAGYTSHYHTYKALTELRKVSDFSTAPITYKVLTDNVLALIKTTVDEQVYVALVNTGETSVTLDLSEVTNLQKYLKVIIANSISKKHNRVLSTNNLVLDGYESVIVRALPNQEEGQSDWWENAVIYQIYPLSFKDNNNDGFGDLQGILSKLEYLKETGVTAAWLSPIYQSPQVDAGYDISDYRKIDTRFGTDEDFDQMVEKAHELGIKIIMDFVPNHSSDQHDWFTKSAEEAEGFEDFYIWHDGTNGGEDPPNNWISLFNGAAWTKHPDRQQWYLHQFAKEQPDLNYRNPVVVAEMKDVLRFWMDRGVDGFRMDAVPYLFEDEDFENEPLSNAPGVPSDEHGYLTHTFTSDQPGTFDMIYQWREFVDDYTKEHGGDARILMTEAYTDIENTMKYYGDDDRDGAQFTFNFQLITSIDASNHNARNIKAAIDEWTTNMPAGRVANWVIGNHDNHRVATRFGSNNVDGFNMLVALLPGVMVTYNGEEIGQENGEVSFDQCMDPRACKEGEEGYAETSRDFERTPFHWDGTVNAGFNTGFEPWLPVSEKYEDLNLANQNIPERQSHYNVYKEIVQLRNNLILTEGLLEVEAKTDNLLVIKRNRGRDICILLFNLGEEMETFEVEAVSDITPYVEVLAMSSESLHSVGELIVSEQLALAPHESVIIITTTDTPLTTPNPTTPDGAASITISFIAFIVTLTCLVLIY